MTQLYKSINSQLNGLLDGETDWVCNLANTAALLWMSLENINWAGFYLAKQGELVLGPFQGKPACTRIAFGKGVCGTAAQTKQAQLVADVHEFAGHIACDAASRSEIVIPMVHNNEVIGVLDIDSPIASRFNQEDLTGLEMLVASLMNAYERFNSPEN